jgi:hypothetical protein
VGGEIGVSWPIEDIPDSDMLYRAVHVEDIRASGEFKPNGFKRHKRGVSMDWSKYSTPEETQHRRKDKPASQFRVAYLRIKLVRGAGFVVEHDPLIDNRAHTEVISQNSPQQRMELAKIANRERPSR